MKTMLLTEAIEQGIVTVGDAKKGIPGDYINYKPEKKVVILTPSQTGYDFGQRFETENLHWRLEKAKGRRLLFCADSISPDIFLCGEKGCKNGISTIELLVKRLYSSHMACKEVSFWEKKWIKSALKRRRWWLGYTSYIIRPVVYLKNDVLVDVSSTDYGSKEKPWIIMESN